MVSTKKNSSKKVGHYAFLAGLVIAVLTGIFIKMLDPSIVPLLLMVLGLVVGMLNITTGEFTEFLVAGVALSLVVVPSGAVEKIPQVGHYISAILLNINTFVVFAVLIVALKAIWQLAEEA